MANEKRQQDDALPLDKLQNPRDFQRGMPIPKFDRIPTQQPQSPKQQQEKK